MAKPTKPTKPPCTYYCCRHDQRHKNIIRRCPCGHWPCDHDDRHGYCFNCPCKGPTDIALSKLPPNEAFERKVNTIHEASTDRPRYVWVTSWQEPYESSVITAVHWTAAAARAAVDANTEVSHHWRQKTDDLWRDREQGSSSNWYDGRWYIERFEVGVTTDA